jgi:two-component system sensor histidine kinase BaeS
MTESGAADESPVNSRATLELRLTLAFVGVALAAVAVLSLLTAFLASADIDRQDNMRRAQLTRTLGVVAAAAFERDHGFVRGDLTPVLNLAKQAGADVAVQDTAGHVVTSTPGFARQGRTMQYTAAVKADGANVGRIVTRFTHRGRIGTTGSALLGALLRAIGGAAGLGALLALITGIIAARLITHPLERIIATVRARDAGARTARIGPIRAPGELRELAAAFDQMSDHLNRQEGLRRDLVADVAHELRTPVAILQAGHEALLDGVAEATPEQLSSLRDEVLRLGRMVSDLQDMAAADAAALHLDLHPCDLAAIAEEAADSMTGRFETAGLRFERHLQPIEVMGDPRWLHHVIMNLLTNALKFTPAGGVVSMDVGPASAGPAATLTVTDTGVGIPADEISHIFDRFWRGRQALQTSGSGIGLAMAAELVRAHHGELAASSEEGQGTQMTVTLPRASQPRA